jgi:hypothetical protein
MFFFHLLPHQFGGAVTGGCKVVVHGIQAVLDVHPNWVVLQVNVMNIFNTILHETIFQKLQMARN